MKSSFISSSAIQNAMRLTIRQSQNQMVQSAVEASTKMYADVGVALGVNTAKSIDFNREIDRIKSIKDSNSVVNLRLEMSQNGLGDLNSSADDLMAKLTALKGSESATTISVTLQQASSAFSTLMGTANSSANGEYLFSGVNTDVPPLTDQSSAAISAMQTNLQAYASGLTNPVTGNPKTVADLDETDMKNFMTTFVEPMFTGDTLPAGYPVGAPVPTSGAYVTNPPAWGDWSSASNQNMTSRISNSEVVTSSTNANSDGMRYFAMATIMTQALAGQGLGTAGMAGLSDGAIDYAGRAVDGLTGQQSQLGLSQERVTKSNDALDAQSTILQGKLIDLTGVDPVEATTIVKNMETQLQTSYTIISKIQQLSLVNYL
ncbi:MULTISPECIES: flagellar hook-associated family protein [unclassified Rhizobium]|jgi:flagellar hook-associated protein 3 FlgL|uniref:flagellar hook-associated family protein n=1 Tax=unclassified Rhizobium TaxID=2613769 RepID=UPI0018F4772E|nr:flagellar hook-associated family protein [Rhizobium sp. BG4]QRM43062.1 flagellar hook-associated family protein [Rhizobium sp. BG4]